MYSSPRKWQDLSEEQLDFITTFLCDSLDAMKNLMAGDLHVVAHPELTVALQNAAHTMLPGRPVQKDSLSSSQV